MSEVMWRSPLRRHKDWSCYTWQWVAICNNRLTALMLYGASEQEWEWCKQELKERKR